MGKQSVETNQHLVTMIGSLCQPASSMTVRILDSHRLGTDNGDIMAFFHNNVLTDITFRLRGGDANHQSTGAISKSDTPKQPERPGKPYAIMRLNVGPAMSIKIVTGTNPTSLPIKETRSCHVIVCCRTVGQNRSG